MINEIKSFLSTCPHLEGRMININHLSSKIGSISLENVSSRKIIKEYTDGSKVYSEAFIIATREGATESVSANSSVSVFFENISSWLEQQSRLEKLPQLTDGLTPLSIVIGENHELKSISDLTSRHEMSFELHYCENLI